MSSPHKDRTQASPEIVSGLPASKITRSQFAACGFVALLSPLMRVLPQAGVVIAGKAAWISVFPACVVLIVLAWFLGVLRKQLLPGEGLADLFLRWLGPVVGRIVLLVYAAWLLLYAGFILQSGAERLVTSIYPKSSLAPFTIMMIIVCLIASLGTLRTTARMSTLLRAILLCALTFVFIFAARDISIEDLAPITRQEAAGILPGIWPYITVGAVASYLIFLSSYVEPIRKPGKWLIPSFCFYGAVAGLLSLEVVGVFGPGMTLQLSHPFFAMVRDISIIDTAQRVDALVLTLSVFADFVLCTVLLRCAHEAIRRVFSLPSPEDMPMLSFRRGRWLQWVEAAIVLAVTFLIPSSSDMLSEWSGKIIPISAACSVYIILPVIWIVGKLRGKMLPKEKGKT